MELLVVISIIGVLATLVIPAGYKIMENAKINKAKTELKQVEGMINQYKLQFGYYPPDHPADPKLNSLYFELIGVTNTTPGQATPALNMFQTLDGAAEISADFCQNNFGAGSILNCAKANGDDVGKPAVTFLKNLKPNQYYAISTNLPRDTTVRILVCTVQWPEKYGNVLPGIPLVNPWRYVVNGATNNPGSYDLWVDIISNGKSNRISNWDDKHRVAN